MTMSATCKTATAMTMSRAVDKPRGARTTTTTTRASSAVRRGAVVRLGGRAAKGALARAAAQGIEQEVKIDAAPTTLLRDGSGEAGDDSAMRAKFEQMIRKAQDEICDAISKLDGKPFHEDAWTRPAGGGGVSRVLQDGNVFEKAGVIVSVVYGQMPPGAYRAGTGEAVAVAREHLVIGEQMVAQRHRLGDLQMGEARHDRVDMALGAVDQSGLQGFQRGIGGIAGIAHPQAKVRRDLVIARARGMQPPGCGPYQLGQPRLDMHVNVFERPVLGDTIGGIFLRDLLEALRDRLGIFGGNDALRAQHRDMRQRPVNILPPQRLVERDRSIYGPHHVGWPGGEASAPHAVGVVSHAYRPSFAPQPLAGAGPGRADNRRLR